VTTICIGCGCTDDRACSGGCSLMRTDPVRRVGVCSNCFRDAVRWDAGDRRISENAHARRIARCRSCLAPIVWFRTISGFIIPINAGSVDSQDTQHDAKRHIAHFATCPNRDMHRRAR